jgi:hypothetical protein
VSTPAERRGLGALAVRPQIIVAAVVAAFVALVAYPLPRERLQGTDPRVQARALVESFNERARARNETGGPDALRGDGGARRTRPQRDLFAPDLRRPAAVAAGGVEVAPAPPSDPVLSAVLLDGASRYAIVGGHRVAEGDSVAGAWVVDIGESSVLLWKGGAYRRLHLKRPK